jgi:hypothetical protein
MILDYLISFSLCWLFLLTRTRQRLCTHHTFEAVDPEAVRKCQFRAYVIFAMQVLILCFSMLLGFTLNTPPLVHASPSWGTALVALESRLTSTKNLESQKDALKAYLPKTAFDTDHEKNQNRNQKYPGIETRQCQRYGMIVINIIPGALGRPPAWIRFCFVSHKKPTHTMFCRFGFPSSRCPRDHLP